MDRMNSRTRVLYLAVGFTTFAFLPAVARAQSFSIGVANENDWYLGRAKGEKFPNDDDYTNGLRIRLEIPRAVLWGGLFGATDCRDKSDGRCRQTTFVFGQNFYTPMNIASAEVIEDDRPYAAWLYVGIAAQLVTEKQLKTVELDIGTTGKPAFGRQAQTWWHCLLGFPQPRGWAHQVTPAPGLVGVIGIWDHKFALPKETKGDDTFVWAELDPYYRLSIGNVFTQAAGGAVVRVGYNVQRSWTQKIPETKRRGSSLAERKWELHGFAGTEARLVGWNALLQHDTYTPRPLPPIKRVVQDFEAGVAVGRGRLSGGFRWVWRTPEYEGGRRSAYAGPYVALQR
jgi:lipid A 3-O-deacylase